VLRIPFQHALQMIANRSVYLDRGFAFVPLQRLVNIIVTRFRIHLSKVPPSSCPDAPPALAPACGRPCQHSLLTLPTAIYRLWPTPP